MANSIKSLFAGKHAPANFLIFSVALFYAMSQAIDLYLFHFIFDIHLPVIAMLVMFAALSIANGRTAFEYLQHFKYLLAILFFWSGYLIINAFFGKNLQTSIVLFFRFVGCWLIAAQLGIFLYTGEEKKWKSVSFALLSSFFLITLIWYLQSNQSPYLQWLQPSLRDPTKVILDPTTFNGWGGLYVNPNILGFALVSHATVAIWYTFQFSLSILIITIVWLTALFGVIYSRSSNSFIGIIAVGLFSVFAYTHCHWETLPKYRRSLRLAAITIVLICILAVIANLSFKPQFAQLLEPFRNYLKTNSGWSTPADEPPGAQIAKVYDDERQSYVYELSGQGLPHHYLYSFGGIVNKQDDNSTFRWSMNFSGPFVVSISVQTDKGPDELLYTSSNMFIDTVYESGLAFELGSNLTDGKWHTVTRDLQADLQKGTPGVKLLGVKAVMIQGQGRIDDINFSSNFHETFDQGSAVSPFDIGRVLSRIDDNRVQIWKRSLGYWKERPLLGIGLGSFQYLPAERTFFHCHNFFLNVLVEQGLIGFSLLVAFAVLLLWQMKSWVGAALLGSFFCSQLFDNLTLDFSFPVYTSFILGYCFFLVIRRKAEKNSQ